MSADKLKGNFESHVLGNLGIFLVSSVGRAIAVYSPEVRAESDEAISIVANKVVSEFSVVRSVEALPRLLKMLSYIVDLNQQQIIPPSLHPVVIRALLAVKVDPANEQQVGVYKELFFYIRERHSGLFSHGVINEIRWRLTYGLSYNAHGDIPSEMPASEWIEVIRAYCVKRAG